MQCLIWSSAAVGLVILVGCSGAPQAILPTTTPAPIQAIPTSTPTPLPPATVTPYPTLTPRAAEGLQTPLPTGEGAASPPSETPTQSATASPAAPPGTSVSDLPSEVNIGRVLFSTDFARGWPSTDEATARISLRDEEYVFEIGPYDGRFLATGALDHSDLYAQVEVSPSECPPGGGYGLIFRFVDPGNYYALIILCNNNYSVISRVNGALAPSPLANGTLPAGLDGTSNSPHTLAVLASVDTYTAYLDGQNLAVVNDARHDSGDIALYAESQSADVIRVAFDNLEIWAVR